MGKVIFLHVPPPTGINGELAKLIPFASNKLFSELHKLLLSGDEGNEIDIISSLDADMSKLANEISALSNNAPIHASHCFNQANDGNKVPLSAKMVTIYEVCRQQSLGHSNRYITTVLCRTQNSFLLPSYMSITQFCKPFATYQLSPMGYWMVDDHDGTIVATDHMLTG